MFQEDSETDGVVLIGEIGGNGEQEAAEYIASDFTKPVVALVVGRSAPAGKRMGHAGAIITGSAGRADEKVKALASAGVAIAPSPGAIGSTVRDLMKVA
jgi:succinyl-CoA synthetase alpha subunit